jgi:ribA/ribD-fused uncharacterized protein
MKTIYFYRPQDQYGILSNFARTPILLDELTWPTSEHLFQALKFTADADNQSYRERIRCAYTPAEAARLGRSRSIAIRSDWENIKIKAMLMVLKLKAYQHDSVADCLKSTEDSYLVEKSYKDSYWGSGPDGNGLNMLGKLWMQVRMEILNG